MTVERVPRGARFLARAVGGSVGAGPGRLRPACRRPSGSRSVLGVGRAAERRASRKLVTPRKAMAQEFAEADRSPQFRSNGTADPGTDDYQRAGRRTASPTAGWRSTAWSSQPSELLARRAARAAGAHADHAPRLRRGLERHRQVEGRAALGAARRGAADSRRRATSCSTAPTRWRPTARDLYYESIDLDDALPSADDPRLRAERRAAAGRQRRAAAAARRAPAGLQAREVRDGASSWSTSFAQHRRRQGRLLGGPGLPVVRGDLTAASCGAPFTRRRRAGTTRRRRCRSDGRGRSTRSRRAGFSATK